MTFTLFKGLVLYQTLSHTLKLAPHESPSSQPLTKNPQQLCYFLCKTLTKDPQQVWQTLNNFDYPQLFGHMQHSYYFTYMEYGLLTIQYPVRSWQLLRCPQIYWGSEVGCISRV